MIIDAIPDVVSAVAYLIAALAALAVVFGAVLPHMPVWAIFAVLVAVVVHRVIVLVDDPSWTHAVMVAVLAALAVRGWWVNYRRGESWKRTSTFAAAWLVSLFAAILLQPYAPFWVTAGLAVVSAAIAFPVGWRMVVTGFEEWKAREMPDKSDSSGEE